MLCKNIALWNIAEHIIKYNHSKWVFFSRLYGPVFLQDIWITGSFIFHTFQSLFMLLKELNKMGALVGYHCFFLVEGNVESEGLCRNSSRPGHYIHLK